MTDSPREIDLGTRDRDRQGRFTKVFTLSYETRAKDTGQVIKMIRHLPADGVETIGKVLMKVSEDVAWNIAVLDRNGRDVTFGFACFGGEGR
ncbi:hypothetical protein [Nonomuraea roseoviolacea]|uniref:Uncharacterized protein n=1 Tax=Nonomuraea roseoviolacea subsp. carminata TaxID=160689 RepID=A0ABT1JYV6_9ACTN|nr:hypothetical protein [Nonomuraea roseoviolacea]MCP2346938.1 hypothetical protein [Nonomuraea roseoviolacea subsp. carminata]